MRESGRDRVVPVVVVGAGPTGLTTGILLAQYGIACTVLDRRPDRHPQPRAVHLDDEVFRILGRLGVADGFAAVSRPAAGLRLLGPDHRVLAEFRRDPGVGRHGYPSANMFDQPDLERLLLARAAELDLLELRTDVEVRALDRSDPAVVGLDLRDGAGRHERLVARYVLGCDGANSFVRAAVGVRMRDLGFAQRWLVVDGRTAHDLGQWEGVHQVCDPARAATYMQVGDDRYRWEFRLLEGETAERFARPGALAPLLGPWVADPAELEFLRVAEYTFRAQVAERWRAGRVLLLGDAAHLTPPFIGQGLGAGQRDAANLTWKLAAVLDGAMPATVLDSYEVERAPHVRDLTRIATGIGRAMTAGGRLGDATRQLVAPRLRYVPGLRRRVTDSASPPLRASALVRRGGPVSLGGTLVPNVRLADGRRFDEAAGGRFVVVTRTAPSDAQRAGIRRRGAVLVHTDDATELGRWLRGRAARAAVVRPDGTVLAAGRDLPAVLARLPAFRAQTGERSSGCAGSVCDASTAASVALT